MIKNSLTKKLQKIKENKNKGFTLVELIVVIVILAILVGVTIGDVYMYIGQSRKNTDANNASAIVSTLSSLGANEKVYPLITGASISGANGEATLLTITVDKDGNADCATKTDEVSKAVNTLITTWQPSKEYADKSYTVTIKAADTDGDAKGDNIKVETTLGTDLSKSTSTSTPEAEAGH